MRTLLRPAGGVLLVGLGAVLLLTPGPGLLVILVGLRLLGWPPS